MKSFLAAATAVVLVCVMAGCSASTSSRKSGFTSLTLTFATIDGAVASDPATPSPQAFVAALQRVSGGRIKASVQVGWGDNAPGAELGLVHAIEGGQIDGGWPSARAIEGAGDKAFDALDSPGLIANYAAEEAVVSSPIASTLLTSLTPMGLQGLALGAGPLRRPFATRPLTAPADWAGVTFRVWSSPVQQATVRAVGAVPVSADTGVLSLVERGSVQGVDFDVAQYQANGYTTQTPYVTGNVVLWPKVVVMTLNERRFHSLTHEQQQWVRIAAEQAGQASLTLAHNDSAIAAQLCATGLHIVSATTTDLLALRRAFATVGGTLANDPAAAPVLAAVRAIVAQHPGTDVLTVPPNCAANSAPGGPIPIPATPAPTPAGTYRSTNTPAELEAFGVGAQHARENTGTITLTVKNGLYQLHYAFANPPVSTALIETGELRGDAEHVVFVPDVTKLGAEGGCTSANGGCDPTADPYRFRWKYANGALTFSDARGLSDPLISATFEVHPFTRIS